VADRAPAAPAPLSPAAAIFAQTGANFYDTPKSSKNLELANPNCRKNETRTKNRV